MQSHHSWIWQQKDWLEFYYNSGILLPHISSASRLIGTLTAICQTLSDTERLDALERVFTDDTMETTAIEGEVLRRSSVRASIRKRLGGFRWSAKTWTNGPTALFPFYSMHVLRSSSL
jgi:Fic family protein